jgi:O-acetyl-ADP-ribose deacetylase
MSAGVAASLKRKGGLILEEEAQRHGPVEVGDAVLTTGGNLAATHVVHAVVMGPDFTTDADTITRATKAVLAVVDKHRITSIALPALGTGVGHVAPAVSADAMLDPVVAHIKAGTSSLRKVIFVLYEDAAYKAFCETLKRHGGAR